MERIFAVLFIIFILLGTSGCRVAGLESDSNIDSKNTIQLWEYKFITARCVLDNATQLIVCERIDQPDNLYMDELILKEVNSGWDLFEIVPCGNNDSLVQSFIFRKPYSIAVE